MPKLSIKLLILKCYFSATGSRLSSVFAVRRASWRPTGPAFSRRSANSSIVFPGNRKSENSNRPRPEFRNIRSLSISQSTTWPRALRMLRGRWRKHFLSLDFIFELLRKEEWQIWDFRFEIWDLRNAKMQNFDKPEEELDIDKRFKIVKNLT